MIAGEKKRERERCGRLPRYELAGQPQKDDKEKRSSGGGQRL